MDVKRHSSLVDRRADILYIIITFLIAVKASPANSNSL